MEKQSGIYKINCTNGKFYVGKSINIRERKWKHFSNLKNNKHPNPHLQACWNKHGKESFSFRVIEYVEPDKLTEREQYYLDLYCGRKNCLNVSDKSNEPKRKPITEEQKRRYREAYSKSVYQWTKEGELIKQWDSVKQAQTELNIGHISEVCGSNPKYRSSGGFVWSYTSTFPGYVPADHTSYKLGRKHSEEWKEKLSKSKLGSLNPMFGKTPWNKKHGVFAGRSST